MTTQAHQDHWASGDAYERYVGRWSLLVGRAFIDWLAEPPDLRWLDVGCGTGALSEMILGHGLASQVVGIDPSDGYIAHARERDLDTRAAFRIGNAEHLPVKDSTFDAAVGGLVLNFLAEPERAVDEMRRAACPDGTVAAYVWDYAGEMQMMRRFWDAAVALDPAARDLDEGVRFPIAQPEPLAALFEAAGLAEIETHAIEVPTMFETFDDYWTPFLSGQGPAPGYCLSLDEDRRAQLRDTVEASLPIEPDGSIHLNTRAWAVRGTVPG